MSKENDNAARDEAARKLRALGDRLRFAAENLEILDLPEELKAKLREQFGTEPTAITSKRILTPNQSNSPAFIFSNPGKPKPNADGRYVCPDCRKEFFITEVLCTLISELRRNAKASVEYPQPLGLLADKWKAKGGIRSTESVEVKCPHCRIRLLDFDQLAKDYLSKP